jgi:phosphohistidine phosphatase
MKTLYLLRHAKSSWAEEGAEDFDRPLAPRGRRAAPVMADYMEKQGYHPGLILCSPAARTRETLALMQERFAAETPTRFEQRLYMASAAELLRVVQALRDKADSLLLVGHNPGLQRFAGTLAGTGERSVLARLHEKFPTAALAVLAFNVAKWKDVTESGGALRDFMTPKVLA